MERTEITDWETQDKNVKVVLPIQNLVQPGTQYRLDLTVKTAEVGELHYYARILADEAAARRTLSRSRRISATATSTMSAQGKCGFLGER